MTIRRDVLSELTVEDKLNAMLGISEGEHVRRVVPEFIEIPLSCNTSKAHGFITTKFSYATNSDDVAINYDRFKTIPDKTLIPELSKLKENPLVQDDLSGTHITAHALGILGNGLPFVITAVDYPTLLFLFLHGRVSQLSISGIFNRDSRDLTTDEGLISAVISYNSTINRIANIHPDVSRTDMISLIFRV